MIKAIAEYFNPERSESKCKRTGVLMTPTNPPSQDSSITDGVDEGLACWIPFHRTGSRNEVEIIHDYIVAKGDGNRNGSWSTNFYSPTPPPLHLAFTLPTDKSSWKSWAILEDKSTPTQTPILFVLTLKRLSVYDLGRSCESGVGVTLDVFELEHFGPHTYLFLKEGRTISISSPNSILIFDQYPPLRLKVQVVIPPGGPIIELPREWEKYITFCKAGGMELIEVEEMLRVGKKIPMEEAAQQAEDDYQTLLLDTKPTPMISLNTTAGFYLEIPAFFPPYVCVRTNTTFQIRPMSEDGDVIYEFASTNMATLGMVQVALFDPSRPRLLVTGLTHGFDVLELSGDSQTPQDVDVSIIFSTEDLPYSSVRPRPVPRSGGGDRSVRPSLTRTNYRILDNPGGRCFSYSYNARSNIFGVSVVEDNACNIFLFDCSGRRFRFMRRIGGLIIGDETETLGCSRCILHLKDSWIGLFLELYRDDTKTKTSFMKLYTYSLLP